MQHDMTAVCQRDGVEQIYIKNKCGHCILLHTIICRVQHDTTTACRQGKVKQV